MKKQMSAVVAAAALMAVMFAPAAFGAGLSIEHLRADWDSLSLERVMTARTVGFRVGSETPPQVVFSESLVLSGAEAACTFTVTCNDDGTVSVDVADCSVSQFGKILKAADDICG